MLRTVNVCSLHGVLWIQVNVLSGKTLLVSRVTNVVKLKSVQNYTDKEIQVHMWVVTNETFLK